MKSPFARSILFVLLTSAATGQAQTLITLTSASAIGGSTVFSAAPYNHFSSAYQAGNLFNQQSGPVDMTLQQNNAWFPSEAAGTTNRFVTIDLGAAYSLSSIVIFNSNQADRGTGTFSLQASNTITTGPLDGGFGTGSVLSSPTYLLSSTPLTYSSSPGVVSGQTFSISDATAYRYLQLTAIDVPTGGGFSNVGLAEVRLYSAAAVPEPSTYALVFGAGALGLAAWRRRLTLKRNLTA
jgi:hypothetical protein